MDTSSSNNIETFAFDSQFFRFEPKRSWGFYPKFKVCDDIHMLYTLYLT